MDVFFNFVYVNVTQYIAICGVDIFFLVINSEFMAMMAFFIFGLDFVFAWFVCVRLLNC